VLLLLLLPTEQAQAPTAQQRSVQRSCGAPLQAALPQQIPPSLPQRSLAAPVLLLDCGPAFVGTVEHHDGVIAEGTLS
jgi:hypothetical protein